MAIVTPGSKHEIAMALHEELGSQATMYPGLAVWVSYDATIDGILMKFRTYSSALYVYTIGDLRRPSARLAEDAGNIFREALQSLGYVPLAGIGAGAGIGAAGKDYDEIMAAQEAMLVHGGGGGQQ